MTVDTQYPNPKHVKVPAAVNSTLARTRRPLTHQLRLGGGTGRGWAMRAFLLIIIINLNLNLNTILNLNVFLNLKQTSQQQLDALKRVDLKNDRFRRQNIEVSPESQQLVNQSVPIFF